MDGTLGKLVGFVRNKNTRLACAAAVCLAELAPREQAAVEALKNALSTADGSTRPFMMDALGRIGTVEAVEALVPFIRKGDQAGQQALRAVAYAGAGALKPLARALQGAEPLILRQLSEAIARTGEKQGYGALLDEWRTVSEDVRQAIREGIQNALPGLDTKGRKTLLRHLTAVLKTKAFVSDEWNCLAALELLGEVGDPEGLPSVMAHAGGSAGARQRAAALNAVGRMRMPPAQRGCLASEILPYLEDDDYVHTVEPALSALRGAELGAEHKPQLQKLAHSTRHEVREFAMKALASLGSKRTFRDLIVCLEDPDRSVREDVASALRQAPEVAPALAEYMVSMKGGESSQCAARVLSEMADRIPDQVLESLARAYIQSATGRTPEASSPNLDVRREEDQRRGALLLVCRTSRRPALANAVLSESRKLRQHGDPHRALALLKSIQGVEGWGGEQKLEQALAGLKIMPIDHARTARAQNQHLRLIEDVLSRQELSTKKVAETILKDPFVDRRTHYVLGHHFSEGVGEERALGKIILEDLAAQKNTDEGRMAKEKLILEGLTEKAGRSQIGILEERAQALMAVADLAAQDTEKAMQREHELARRVAEKDAESKEARNNARKKMFEQIQEKAEKRALAENGTRMETSKVVKKKATKNKTAKKKIRKTVVQKRASAPKKKLRK